MTSFMHLIQKLPRYLFKTHLVDGIFLVTLLPFGMGIVESPGPMTWEFGFRLFMAPVSKREYPCLKRRLFGSLWHVDSALVRLGSRISVRAIINIKSDNREIRRLQKNLQDAEFEAEEMAVKLSKMVEHRELFIAVLFKIHKLVSPNPKRLLSLKDDIEPMLANLEAFISKHK